MKWRKSTACNTTTCVLVGVDKTLVYVKSTRGDQVVIFNDEEWTAFLTGVKAGEFDRMFDWDTGE